MSGVQFQLKNRQEIKALANQGQQAYDELTRKYFDEKSRQLESLEARIEDRKAQAEKAAEDKERLRLEQEHKEELALKEAI